MKRFYDSWRHGMARFSFGSVIPFVAGCNLAATQRQSDQRELDDVHFHLTNHILEGTVNRTLGFYTGGDEGCESDPGRGRSFLKGRL
jgi:hypothetical protein